MKTRNKVKQKYRIESYLLSVADKVLTPMPVRTRHYIATIVGAVLYYFIPIRKKIVFKNLKIAFPESNPRWRRKVGLKTFIHFSKVFLDFFSVWQDSLEKLNRYVLNPDTQIITNALSREKGAILVFSHFGNWEAIFSWLCQNGYHSGAIAKRQKNPLADRFFSTVRELKGGKLFSVKESPVTILNFLKGNGILGIVADQDARKRGIFVRFFNQWSSTFRGPAVFALRQECPLIAVTCLLEKDLYKIHLKEISTSIPKDIKESPVLYLTQLYTDYFEKKIREYPDQYFWFHRRWKTKPSKEILIEMNYA
ncbi:MAG: lysophospholipid acyltransferase family protein [Candidatus Marinimicrobia bacterium]|nr:lysophospholipid acyltransferase family protein [Candidatus Neomarinimicrobiota bacterium]